MDKDDILELYKLFRNELHISIDLHRKHLQHYLTFITAVLGATIAGFYQVGLGWLTMILVIGPVINIFMCMLAIRMCDRFYEGMLEDITITAKLEDLIGLLNPRGNNETVFPNDRFIVPERWLKGREFATSAEFVEKNMDRGVNEIAKRIFYVLILVNAILGITFVILSLYSEYCKST
jgi:hypothetical protein